MGSEAIILGLISIAFGGFLVYKQTPTTIAILFILFGIVLIIFNRDEDIIEQRKDLKQQEQ